MEPVTVNASGLFIRSFNCMKGQIEKNYIQFRSCFLRYTSGDSHINHMRMSSSILLLIYSSGGALKSK